MHEVSWLLIEPGWRVNDSNGDELGSVEEVIGDQGEGVFDGLAVVAGLGDRTHYVPAEHVASILSDGTITLQIDDNAFELLPEPGRP
jgi:uncharacterized protein YrrD